MQPDPDERVHPGKEALNWGAGANRESVKGSTATAKYSRFTETARQFISSATQCSMFCGGKMCKYCTRENWKPSQMAIDGLYSEWVTENILAMARPSNHGMDNYRFLEQFQENRIRTVINLQERGEHATCGYGNDSSGFSYNPQRLMEKDIYFYNFAWQDFGVAPMATMVDIVKVMQFGVSIGKVAVHCHAGLGRTGLLIACYLVYNNRIEGNEAVHYVRSNRPNAIQTSQQVQAVLDFETHLKPFRIIFPSKIPDAQEVNLKCFLHRQHNMLHGFEARRLRHIPKVLYVCCERLLELAGYGPSLQNLREYPRRLKKVCKAKHKKIIPAPSSSHNVSPLENVQGVTVALLEPPHSRSLEDLNNTSYKSVLNSLNAGSVSCSSVSSDCYTSEDERGLESENEDENSQPSSPVQGASLGQATSNSKQEHFLICQSLVKTEYTPEVRKRVDILETQLNLKDEAWSMLAHEEAADVLSAVLWDWLNQLKEPVILRQDMNILLGKKGTPTTLLQEVDKSVKTLLEYLALFVSKLFPQEKAMEKNVLEMLLSHVSQQHVVTEVKAFTQGQLPRPDWPTMPSNDSTRLLQFFYNLIDVVQVPQVTVALCSIKTPSSTFTV